MDNQKNLLLAVVFSIAVLFGFDFFFGPSKNVPQENLVDNQHPVEGETPSFRTSIDGDEAPSIKSSPSLLKTKTLTTKKKGLLLNQRELRGVLIFMEQH